MIKAYLFYKNYENIESEKFLCDFHVNLEIEENIDIANQIDEYLIPYSLENTYLKNCDYFIVTKTEGIGTRYFYVPSETELIEIYDFMNNLYKRTFLEELGVLNK